MISSLLNYFQFSVPCENLTAPSSGRYEQFTNGSFTSATFTCTFGYDLVGSMDLSCRSDGTWDHSVPQCGNYMGQSIWKCILCHMRKTKAQISLRIRTVWSAPLFFTALRICAIWSAPLFFHCLNSMICILDISKISRFTLASVAEQAGFNITWSKIPEDMLMWLSYY